MFFRPWVLAAFGLAAFRLACPGELLAQQNPPVDGKSQTAPASPTQGGLDVVVIPLGKIPVAVSAPVESIPEASAPKLPQNKFPNFATCPIAEIQVAVPELAHLKAEEDQSQLTALLDKIGAKTVEMVGKTPNLVSHEVVVSEQNGSSTRANYSFLILQHPMGKDRVFDEYRVDAATGEKLQTDFIENDQASKSAGESASVPNQIPVPKILPETKPTVLTSQGFVSSWLYFHPSNRRELEYRYLGQEKLDGRQTLVVAFAQKPGSVELPAVFDYNQQTYRVFMQGVAWIDPAEFRILRLQSDLLSVPAALPLYRLSVEIQFGKISPVGVASPLWLPTQAVVTTNLIGSAARERHTYSNYRLFKAQSRIAFK